MTFLNSILKQSKKHEFPFDHWEYNNALSEGAIEEIIQALCKNKAVEIRGWGRFKTVIRKARVGRNPKNAQIIQIPEKKAIKWKMSKVLYNKINQNLKEQDIFPN